MLRFVRHILLIGLLLGVGGALSSPSRAQDHRPAPHSAYLIVDVGSRKTIAVSRLEALQAVVAPGSIAKLATLIAALRPSLGIVVVAPGAAGSDAAALAADLIREQMRAHRQPAAEGEALNVGQIGLDGKTTIVTMPIDEYVASVVAGEQQANSPPAALEALAITARTYALANRRRHAREGFDLCDLTHCQVLKPATPSSRAASTVTRSRVLLFNGRPASVFYTASCGGRTERGDAVWPQARFPFLPSQLDAGCERLPGWSSELRTEDLERALRANGLKGQLASMRVVARTASGRASTVRMSGFVPPEIDGDTLRFAVGRTLGWQHVKSTWFDISRTANGYRFTGRGSGHGVGLCMVGSIRWAAQGLTADDILHRYFPGLTTGAWPTPQTTDNVSVSARVLVQVPAMNAGERRHLTIVVQSELEGLARRLGVETPAELAVVFHPTVESYRRATKQPWWMAAATTGQRIDLLPIATLRAKGLLEQTIRHELVHVLTVDALRQRPMWVKEGAALFFAGEVVAAAQTPTTCPPRKDASATSHRDVTRRDYLQAGTCFAKAMASGGTWSGIH
ncbi:MAG: SpoIID/LytB domain-containing protein [Acidobacteria bacterium]|nr:SpoIID/LytB domain-containing protein [Acidobacteriota bacterium]